MVLAGKSPIFSFLTEICLLKKLFHRKEVQLEAHLCYLAVVFNLLLTLAGTPTAQQMLPVLKDFAFYGGQEKEFHHEAHEEHEEGKRNLFFSGFCLSSFLRVLRFFVVPFS